MTDDSNNNFDQPYEKWAQHKEPVWPLIIHRLRAAIFGGAVGLVLGLLGLGIAQLTVPDQVIDWNWEFALMAFFAGACSAVIQNWRK